MHMGQIAASVVGQPAADDRHRRGLTAKPGDVARRRAGSEPFDGPVGHPEPAAAIADALARPDWPTDARLGG
jgi:hypothetical protein